MAVTYGIVAEDQAYVITGTVTDENAALLRSVEESVDSFRVLKDETLKTVTNTMISGTVQQTTETQPSTESGSSNGGTGDPAGVWNHGYPVCQ